jgi:hypothetical protein
MRRILSSPQAWQMETALVDQAVVKFIRGPTSSTSLQPEPLGLECLAQEPGQRLQLTTTQAAGCLDVEAELGCDVLDIGGDPLPRSLKQRVGARW